MLLLASQSVGNRELYLQHRGGELAVRQCYLERATGEPDRFRVVDAGVGLDQVRAQLENHLQEMLQWR